MRTDIRGRFPVESPWPQGGTVTKELGDRNYTVQQFTGYTPSTVKGGNWNRGIVYRFATPMLRLPRESRMYDPTDINTWPVAYK